MPEFIDKIKSTFKGREKAVSLVAGGGVVLCLAVAALIMGVASTSSATGDEPRAATAADLSAAAAAPDEKPGSESGQGSASDPLEPDQIQPTAPPSAFAPPPGSPVGDSPRSGGSGTGASGEPGNTGGTPVSGPVTPGSAMPDAPSSLNPSTLTVDQLQNEINAATSAQDQAEPQPGELTVKRSADEALPVAKLTGSPITDSTDYLIANFGRDVDAQQNSASVSMSKDACLLDWARASLPTMNGAGKTFTTDACGRTAAVIVGGYSVSGRDMILRAMYDQQSASLKSIIFGAPALHYASVASSDGQAVMIVVTRP